MLRKNYDIRFSIINTTKVRETINVKGIQRHEGSLLGGISEESFLEGVVSELNLEKYFYFNNSRGEM